MSAVTTGDAPSSAKKQNKDVHSVYWVASVNSLQCRTNKSTKLWGPKKPHKQEWLFPAKPVWKWSAKTIRDTHTHTEQGSKRRNERKSNRKVEKGTLKKKERGQTLPALLTTPPPCADAGGSTPTVPSKDWRPGSRWGFGSEGKCYTSQGSDRNGRHRGKGGNSIHLAGEWTEAGHCWAYLETRRIT